MNIMAMVKDGGYVHLQINAKQVSQLAIGINEKGSETVQLQSGAVEVVGFLMYGKQAGERIIVLSEKGAPDASHDKPVT